MDAMHNVTQFIAVSFSKTFSVAAVTSGSRA